MNFDWGELAFGSKKPVGHLKAAFIMAPRELSGKRFAQLIKTYLPKGNIVLGLAKEPYVLGFEDQPQFQTLQMASIKTMIKKVNAASTTHKLYTLSYFQRELPFILDKLSFARVIGINGSWHHSFHLRPEYYRLNTAKVSYELVTPFSSEAEAKIYAKAFDTAWTTKLQTILSRDKSYSENELLALCALLASESFDYTHQIGVVLAQKKTSTAYQVLATATNRVVPYQTYAMHHGSQREQHFSPANDLNFYDTIHAETELLIQAQKQKIDLSGTTLYINVLPCPTCARNLSRTDIAEIVYQEDHSAGYALQLLEAAGKTVRRLL